MSVEPHIVGIRFQQAGKVYFFDSSAYPEVEKGSFVVVDTSRGRQIGEVVQIISDGKQSSDASWKRIAHPASAQDMTQRQYWRKKEIEAIVNCRAKAAENHIIGVKFVAAEYSFDGGRLSFLYNNESGEKMELKSLRRSMQRLYPQTQIEFHLIGPRDVAKIIGGIGACGLETRCCTKFLTEFSPISIKMAKEQGISLTPTEITGMCGRLRCCLIYEYELYVEARKSLPKRNKRVGTPAGEGKVVDIYPIKDSVLVEMESGTLQEFSREDLVPLEELEALKKKAESGCDKHPDGGCECGKRGSSKHRGGKQ
jgi:cell fate regulator YaaT (PSP1 superfamily)